jgi:RNA polymerase sigma factor (sigma-70 family)
MAASGTDLHALLTHAAWLRRLARRLADQAADADDLLQETWTAAWLRPPDSNQAPGPWLAEVLRNFRRMKGRASSRRRERERMAGDELLASEPGPHERLARVELQHLLAALVLELEEPYRSAVLLHYYEERSTAEIAALEGIAPATVRWRLRQGMERLRVRLDQRHGGRRNDWLLAVPAGPRSAAWLAKGVLVMKAKANLSLGLLALLLLLVGATSWWWHRVRPEERVAAQTSFAPPKARRQPWATALGGGGTSATAELDGIVLDPEGRGVPGAVVALVRRLATGDRAAPLAGVTTTDEGGRFRVDRLAPGTLTATATAGGFTPAVERDLELSNGSTRSVRLVLGRGGFTLQGLVRETGGGTLPGARVTVRATPTAADSLGLLFVTAADTAGRWSVPLPGGQYAVSAEFDGYAAQSTSVTLTSPQRADLTLEPAGGFFGRVVHALTGEPIPGARVQAIPTFRRGTRAPAVETDFEGKFRLQRLGLGDLVVQARLGRLVGQVGPVAVVPALATMDLEIRVHEAFAITGRVSKGDDPAAGVAVMAESKAGTAVAWGETSAAGAFVIEGLLPDDYQLQVWLKDGGRARLDVTVVDRDVTGLELKLTPGLAVRGRVHRRGQPMAGARVIVTTEAGADGGRYNRIATSDVRGEFQLPPDIPWGTLFARASAADAIALFGPHSTEPGAQVELDLALETGAALAGLVRRADGTPAAGAHVAVISPEGARGERAAAVAGPDGRYRLTGLAPGWARVAASAWANPRLDDGFERVQLAAGQDVDLDLRVPASANIRGVVRLVDGRPAAGALVLAGSTNDKPWPEQARRAVAAADGTFQLDGLVRGRSYHLWVDLPGHATAHRANVAAGTDVGVSLAR